MEEGFLEKTRDGVLIYSNTENKLKEIMERFVDYKNEINELKMNRVDFEERKTIQKKLFDTVFDDDYLDEKVKEISMSYVDKYGALNPNKMYLNNFQN